MLRIEPSLGESIQTTAQRAVQFSDDRDAPVQFDFNGVHIVVQTGDTELEVIAQWDSECKRQSDEYHASPQYAFDQAEKEVRRKRFQKTVTNLCACLPACILRGDDVVVRWVGEFARPADHVGVIFDPYVLVDKLEAAGYVNNAYVGDDEVKASRLKQARWMIGQAINCLALGIPPHPVLIEFARQYAQEAD